MKLQDLNQISQLASVALDLARALHAQTDRGIVGDAASDRNELNNVVYRLEITLASLGRLRHKWEAIPEMVETEDSDEITDRTETFAEGSLS